MVMKITRFAQSCFLIETKGKRILVDPGVIQYKESYLSERWGNIDVLLVTHKHGDHCNVEAIKKIIEGSRVKFYTTREVSDEYPELSPDIIKEGDVLNLEGIKIEIVKAVHGYIPLLKGGKEVYENVGYIIDDGVNRIYHVSDSICFDNNYKCDILLVPVVNHGLVMGSWEAALFAKETGAKLVIPMHYDNPIHPADFEKIKNDFEHRDLNFKFLGIEEAVEF